MGLGEGLEGLWEVVWGHGGPSGCGDHGGLAGGQWGLWECGWPLGTLDIMSGRGVARGPWRIMEDRGGPWGRERSWEDVGDRLGPWGCRGSWVSVVDHGALENHGGPCGSVEEGMGLWGVLRDCGRWIGVTEDHHVAGITGTMGDWGVSAGAMGVWVTMGDYGHHEWPWGHGWQWRTMGDHGWPWDYEEPWEGMGDNGGATWDHGGPWGPRGPWGTMGWPWLTMGL